MKMLNKITYKDIEDEIFAGEDNWNRIKDTVNGYIGIKNGGFYEIRKQSKNSKENACGWKFHIGLDCSDIVEDENGERFPNLEKGFEIAYDILIKHNIALFKVMTPENLDQIVKLPEEFPVSQLNKQITIYASANPEKSLQDWQNIFTEITEAYQENGIKFFPNEVLLRELERYYQKNGEQPSPKELEDNRHRSEKRISGSDFISYRYDLDKNSNYLAAEKAQDYRSGSECEDPYFGIDLSKTRSPSPK